MNTPIKIYMLGNINHYLDEAQKNITNRLFKELAEKHDVTYKNAKENLFNLNFWKHISEFNPDIIHVFLRPTTFVLLYAKLFKLYTKKAKIIISAFQPPQIPYNTTIIKILKPDLYITISNELSNYFKNLGCNTITLYCGVDVQKFKPVTKDKKIKLRKKYGIPQNKYIILHVGHATKGRNLLILKNLLDDKIQPVFVSSKSFNIEKSLVKELKQSGCITFCDYIENIEELYQLSDCYICPTINESNSIALPLSVLEAMACNIPVVATRFGALSELFKDDGSFLFFNGTTEDLAEKIQLIMKSHRTVANRDKVLKFDWKNVTKKLEDIYQAVHSNGL